MTSQTDLSTVGVGVVVPYDFALDRELWRWVPEEASLHLTRTPFSPLPVGVEQAALVGERSTVTQCVRDLMTVQPDVVAYGCTSGSFVGGVASERELVGAMLEGGAPAAVTTSGALLEALRHLDVTRVGVATPYDTVVSNRLRGFLREAGFEVTSLVGLGLTGRIWSVPYDATVQLVREAATAECEAVFVSCTNLRTYDVIASMEQELGIPVLTANQVTMWAALRRAGLDAVPAGQHLLEANTGKSSR